MEPLDTTKKHKIAALTTLMISRGMFSRDHISPPHASDPAPLLHTHVDSGVSYFTWETVASTLAQLPKLLLRVAAHV